MAAVERPFGLAVADDEDAGGRHVGQGYAVFVSRIPPGARG
jgi:hypothetical protein